jgi:hypothetical protein
MQRSAVGSVRLACSGSGGSFLRTGLLRQSILRACLGDQQRCSLEINDVARLEAGNATAIWRSVVSQVWRSGVAAGLKVWQSLGLEV